MPTIEHRGARSREAETSADRASCKETGKSVAHWRRRSALSILNSLGVKRLIIPATIVMVALP